MAECDLCGREMLEADSCVEHVLVFKEDDETYTRPAPKHDFEGSLDASDRFEQCPDCGVSLDGYHHPICDWARDPRTGDQLLGAEGLTAHRVTDEE